MIANMIRQTGNVNSGEFMGRPAGTMRLMRLRHNRRQVVMECEYRPEGFDESPDDWVRSTDHNHVIRECDQGNHIVMEAMRFQVYQSANLKYLVRSWHRAGIRDVTIRVLERKSSPVWLDQDGRPVELAKA